MYFAPSTGERESRLAARVMECLQHVSGRIEDTEKVTLTLSQRVMKVKNSLAQVCPAPYMRRDSLCS
jgi:hypothetical protein